MLGLRSYLLLTVALAAGPANAAIVTYSNTMGSANHTGSYSVIRDLWEDALSSQNTVTFEDPGFAGRLSGVLTYDTAVGCATYSACVSGSPLPPGNATTAQFRTVFSGQPNSVVSTGAPVPGKFFASYGGGYVQVDLPTPTTATVTAFAANLWTTSPAGSNITVQVYTPGGSTPIQTYLLPTNNNSTAAFFGLTSDDAIGFVRFLSNDYVALDQFDFGVLSSGDPGPGPAETPESATLGYVGIGALAIYFGTHRKARQQS